MNLLQQIQRVVLASIVVLSSGVVISAQSPVSLTPITPTAIQNPNAGSTIVEYLVTNHSKRKHTFTMLPMSGASQAFSQGACSKPFALDPQASCPLRINIERDQLLSLNQTPQVCKTQSATDNTPSSFLCSIPSKNHLLSITTLNPNFPYGATPTGNVCVSSDYYATPETMLGSWAMVDAVAMDSEGLVLPSFLTPSNVVYAVGTAAIGNALGISNCSGGCNELNGYCFALKFNGKTPYPYMIFQSVNIGANTNSFDIYMAGGGSGAFPGVCNTFWGTQGQVNWASNIENSSCSGYFGDYSSIQSNYSVTYQGVVHDAKSTLENACNFASNGQTGFNSQNWSNITVVPVTCPTSLIQITGLELPSTITTVGNQTIHNLSTLQDSDFANSTVTGITSTQMQDCKTPSSGYCNNVPVSVPNYQASISASLTAPLLQGAAPSSTYCEENPGTSYCSWNDGQSSGGGAYCNANEAQCIACGNSSKWCICNNQTLKGCFT